MSAKSTFASVLNSTPRHEHISSQMFLKVSTAWKSAPPNPSSYYVSWPKPPSSSLCSHVCCMFSPSYCPWINPVFFEEYKPHKFRREIVGSHSGIAEASLQVSWHMTPCRWASGFRRFERTCCLDFRGPAVRADPSTDTADEVTAIVGTASNDLGSHSTVSAPSLYKLLHSSLPPSHLLAVSRPAAQIALLLVSATLNEHLRRQSRGLILTAPFLISSSFRAGDY